MLRASQPPRLLQLHQPRSVLTLTQRRIWVLQPAQPLLPCAAQQLLWCLLHTQRTAPSALLLLTPSMPSMLQEVCA